MSALVGQLDLLGRVRERLVARGYTPDDQPLAAAVKARHATDELVKATERLAAGQPAAPPTMDSRARRRTGFSPDPR